MMAIDINSMLCVCFFLLPFLLGKQSVWLQHLCAGLMHVDDDYYDDDVEFVTVSSFLLLLL